MEKKINWDDIPSLDGLDVDWEYKQKDSHEKRAFTRFTNGDVSTLCEVKTISVKIVTSTQTLDGLLLDVSEGGASVSLPALIDVGLPLKIGFYLGIEKIISKARVKHSRKASAQNIIGIEFVDLKKESAEYISGLYSAKFLRHH